MSEQESEPRVLSPFKIINRGEDTLGPNDEVVFADFSPKVLPADAPDEDEIVVIPKEESAPVLVPSSELMQTTEQQTSETDALPLVGEEDGKPSPIESLTLDSSSNPKSGQNEPPA